MTNYYVKNGGENSNTGLSDAQAWATIGQVNKFTFKTGDNVFFKCGGTWEKQMLVVDWSGTADNRVVVGAYYGNGIIGVSGDKPVIEGTPKPNDNSLDPGGYPSNIYLSLLQVSGDYVDLKNIKVYKSAAFGIKVIHSNGSNTTINNVNVKNCEIDYVQMGGLLLFNLNVGNITNNDITNTGRSALVSSMWGGALVPHSGSRNLLINKNKIYRNHGEGLITYSWCHDSIIEKNSIFENTKAEVLLSGEYAPSTNTTYNIVLRNNLIYGTIDSTYHRGGHPSVGIYINDSNKIAVHHIDIYNNLIANCFSGFWVAGANTIDATHDINIYNNTVMGCEECFSNLGANFNNVFVKNNIFADWTEIAANVGIEAGLGWDYNLWSSDPGNSEVYGPNNPPYAPPKLTKTSGWNNLIGGELIPEDFMLQPDSPAIDKGTYIDGMTHDFFGTPIPQGSAPDIGAVEYTDVSDPCEGVVCDNICIGDDLWSQKCVDGFCIPDKLIESNSSTCGYDPCEGVVCDNICIGKDLWSQKCVDGSCVPDKLIESNSVACGYDPCEGVVCDNVCVGDDLWSRKCVDGDCVPDQLIESNSVTCELCEGVVCGNICVGNDLWSQRCDSGTGNCVADQLLQQDSINCTIPDQVPSDESTIKTYIILGGFGLMGLAMLMLSKK